MDLVAKRLAIEEIGRKARYSRLMDTRDPASMGPLFCRDARRDGSEVFFVRSLDGAPAGSVGPITRGREAIMDWISYTFASATP